MPHFALHVKYLNIEYLIALLREYYHNLLNIIDHNIDNHAAARIQTRLLRQILKHRGILIKSTIPSLLRLNYFVHVYVLTIRQRNGPSPLLSTLGLAASSIIKLPRRGSPLLQFEVASRTLMERGAGVAALVGRPVFLQNVQLLVLQVLVLLAFEKLKCALLGLLLYQLLAFAGRRAKLCSVIITAEEHSLFF